MADGKQLEEFVAFVERTVSPSGLNVEVNERVTDDEGRQVAEFDVRVTGKFGTTNIDWLIECRDRPSHGAAPASWIEQLIGRRQRFGFSRVTAVSTTGFSAGALKAAADSNIELREVADLAPESFRPWLGSFQGMIQVNRTSELTSYHLVLSDSSTPEQRAAVEVLVAGQKVALQSVRTGEFAPADQIFLAVVTESKLFDQLIDGGDPLTVQVQANYPEPDHFVIPTDAGLVRVDSIVFTGILRSTTQPLAMAKASEYRSIDAQELYSQVASFEPVPALEQTIIVELHKVEGVDDVQIVMKRGNA